MTQKDRKIANQEVMIKNRDKLLKYQTEKVAKLEATIRQISAIASSNKYGNERAGIKPGTEFEDLPETWVCPVCGEGKDMFEIHK